MKTFMEAEVQTESASLSQYVTDDIAAGVGEKDEADDDVRAACDDDQERERIFENTLLQLKIAKNLREAQLYSKTVDFESDWNSDDDF